MAVDSAQKRYSLVGLGSPVPRLLPIPQGSLAADDRALLIYLYSGLSLGEVAVAEPPSGGWFREPKPRFRGETDAERDARIHAERDARIHAERIRMGILSPDDINSDTTGDINVAPGLSTTLSTVGGESGVRSSTYSLAAHLLPEDLAGLEALAARAAQLTMDEEIAMWLRLDQQRRLYAEWLRDEDDAAVLMLAIATLH